MLFFENLIRALSIFNGLRSRYCQRALLVYHYRFSTLCKSTILRAPSLLGGHLFQQMTVEFPDIEGPAATAVCDLAVRPRGRPAAVGQALRLHPPKDAIELLLRDVKRVMVALHSPLKFSPCVAWKTWLRNAVSPLHFRAHRMPGGELQ